MNKLRVLLCLPFFMITSCFDYTVTKYFDHYEEMKGSAEIEWLPDYFPEEATDIKLIFNLDFNDYVVGFFLEKTDEKRFEENIKGNSYIRKTDENIKSKFIRVFDRKSDFSNDFSCFFSNQNKQGEYRSWSILYKKNDYYFIAGIR